MKYAYSLFPGRELLYLSSTTRMLLWFLHTQVCVSLFNNVAEVDFVVESNQSILSSSNILGALFNNDDEMMSFVEYSVMQQIQT